MHLFGGVKLKISLLGSGSWGTAIAVLLSNNHDVILWSHQENKANTIINDKENKEYLPGIKLSDNIIITSDLNKISSSDMIVLAVPSKFIRETARKISPIINENAIIVNLSKGLEEGTLLRLSEVIREELPIKTRIAVLSGPSHAEEVSKGIPTAVVAASNDIEIAKIVQSVFMGPTFRVYTNIDMVGVELGGAIKNVIALAAGMSDGLGNGDNTKAALMTRGIVEAGRLGVAMGGNPKTLNGLAGVGDLIVTCTSMHSRNRRAGILLGKGKTLDETLNEIHMVVEGVNTAKAAYDLSVKYNVDMPITYEINQTLFSNKNPKTAVFDLMTRNKTMENIEDFDEFS